MDSLSLLVSDKNSSYKSFENKKNVIQNNSSISEGTPRFHREGFIHQVMAHHQELIDENLSFNFNH